MADQPDTTGEVATQQAPLSDIRIGISGWNYPKWRHGFYANVPQRDWLAHCTRHFTGVEINATFFRFMKADVVATWRAAAPPGFLYALKGHRFITHRQRLRDTAPLIRRMRESTLLLGPMLGAVLWQLPPPLTCDLHLLEDFAGALAGWPEARHAIEFRHDSWFTTEIASLMSREGLAVCHSEGAEWPSWPIVTTDFCYVRLYSPVDGAPPHDLVAWENRIRQWRAEARSVHLYFDTFGDPEAPYEAMRLIDRLRGPGAASTEGEPLQAVPPPIRR